MKFSTVELQEGTGRERDYVIGTNTPPIATDSSPALICHRQGEVVSCHLHMRHVGVGRSVPDSLSDTAGRPWGSSRVEEAVSNRADPAAV